jgi:hypothetical protein
MTTHGIDRNGINPQNNEIDTSMKFENDTSHIEGIIKGEEQDGIVAISEAESKRMRRKIHARCVCIS